MPQYKEIEIAICYNDLKIEKHLIQIDKTSSCL